MEKIGISARAAASLTRPNLWIFSNEINSAKKAALEPGSWVYFENAGRVVATGYYNPHSLIAGRVLATGAVEDRSALLRERLQASFQRRREVYKEGSCRLVFSEGDFLPGLIVDVYGRFLVAQSNTAGMDRLMEELVSIIPDVFKDVFSVALDAFVIRADSSIRSLEGVAPFSKIVFGDEAKIRRGSFSEGDVQFAADYIDGQKTGFFLDQRDNRRYLRSRAFGTGSKVLDLFCYSGGWGLNALKAGAESVVFVDQSSDAIEQVKMGMSLNQFAPSRARFIESDVFDFLERDNDRYDVVVLDPPAFVKSKKNIPQAVKAYEKCNRLALRRLKPGGLLLTSSCSYHLSAADFDTLVRDAFGKEKVAAHVVYQGAQATDHPILLSMPETRYLKCLGVRRLS
jgi:23S rRNA (cytosine1962-C5)-methyltransferase